MSDRYQSFALSSVGGVLSKQAGLPQPPKLARYEVGQPVVSGPVLVGGAPGGRLLDPVVSLLKGLGADVRTEPSGDGSSGDRNVALVFDASGIGSSAKLRELYEFFHPIARSIAPSGRVIVLGTPPEDCTDPSQHIAQRALEGFVRSVGKEFGKGSTANLVYVREGAEAAVESTLRFFLSSRSAYVSGQVVRVGLPGSTPGAATTKASGKAAGKSQQSATAKVVEPADWDQPLAGKVALVTGAARGIGEAIASTLARDGATVVALDVPGAGEALSKVANRIGGLSLQLDITSAAAPRTLAEYLSSRFGGVDIVVHNAGVTRDKTIANMDDSKWDMVLDINLSSQERINDVLVSDNVLRENGRIISVSSVSGIAGNRGQTNYATSKAGVIGLVEAYAPVLAAQGATVNAVAPGFIETAMTDAMPLFVREGGRRLNSMLQGGQPVDVAETIAWLASPASAGVNGNLVRVCGQALIGA